MTAYQDTHCYIVAYDLNNPGQDYDRLKRAIEQISTWYAPLQKSLFFIASNTGRRQDIYAFLKANMDVNDQLCVIEFNGATLDILKSLQTDLQLIIDTGSPSTLTQIVHNKVA